MAELGTLTVDESFYLLATGMFGRLEGGDNPYDIWDACKEFIEDPRVHARFRIDVGREWQEERAVARGFVGAVIYPDHNRALEEYFEDDLPKLDEPTADVIRSAMWSFLTAWAQRYGGWQSDLAKRPTVVDPRIHSAPSLEG